MSRLGFDDEPMVLLDDQGHDVPPTVATPARRGPRREWLLLVAAAAVVIGVGLLGDDHHAPEAAPTTTTSAVPTTAHRRFTSTVRRFRVTTTTVLVPGAPAPFPTATALVFQDPRGAVDVVDLDSGQRCTVDRPDTGMAQSWGTTSRAIVQAGPQLALVDAACGLQDVAAPTGSYPIGIGDTHFWTSDQSSGAAGPLVEHDFATGAPTGNRIDGPSFVGPAVTSGDRLVVGVGGQMTEVIWGAIRDVGAGTPLALRGSTLAAVQCERIQCRLHVIDLDTRANRAVTPEGMEIVPWGTGSFSPDGTRLLAQAQLPGEPSARMALIDLRSGSARVLPREYHEAVFTVDGAHLVVVSGAGADLLSLDFTHSWPIDDVSESGIVAIAGRGDH